MLDYIVEFSSETPGAYLELFGAYPRVVYVYTPEVNFHDLDAKNMMIIRPRWSSEYPRFRELHSHDALKLDPFFIDMIYLYSNFREP